MYLAESQLLSYVGTFRDTLWPGGSLKPSSVPRTDHEKVQTREQAHSKLSSIMPGKLKFSLRHCFLPETMLSRLGCEYDWSLECTARRSPDVCCDAEPTVESAYSLFRY